MHFKSRFKRTWVLITNVILPQTWDILYKYNIIIQEAQLETLADAYKHFTQK